MIVENGKLMHRQTGKLVHTVELGSKWIFVLSTSRALYVGQETKGVFQHSSFLSGGAASAAGRLVAHNGVLEVHYISEILLVFNCCAIDDDKESFIDPTDHQHESMGSTSNATNREAPVYDLSKRLSCKWSTESGPRIECRARIANTGTSQLVTKYQTGLPWK